MRKKNVNQNQEIKNERESINDFMVFNMNTDERVYEEKKNKSYGYIDWGYKNEQPDYLLKLYESGSKHRAIVDNKVKLIVGNGFKKEGLSDNAKLFLRNDAGDENFDRLAIKWGNDLEIYNGFCINVILRNDRKGIAAVKYVDPYSVRINNNETDFFVAEDWAGVKRKTVTPIPIAGFNHRQFNRNEINQLYFVRPYTSNMRFYPRPSYLNVSNYIELDGLIGTYQLNQANRGFQANLIINFNELPPKDKMDEFITRMNKQYKGVKGDTVIYTFSKGKDNAPIITPIPLNESDKKYENLMNSIRDNIFEMHNIVNPALHGLRVEGSLGNTNDKELINSLKLFQSMYVDQRQSIIETAIREIASVNGITDKFELEEFKLKESLNVSIPDLLQLQLANIDSSQKIAVLVAAGYDEETANRMIYPNGIKNNGLTNG